jgi:hypothetical protein
MTPIQDRLNDLLKVFAETSAKTYLDMFGKTAEIPLPWSTVEQLDGQFDMILCRPSSNNVFNAITVVGAQYDSFEALTGNATRDKTYVADVLGELDNTWIGALNDDHVFRGHFGVMTQGIPVLYHDGSSLLPFIWGAQGYLYVGDHWIYLGYTIRHKEGMDHFTRQES